MRNGYFCYTASTADESLQEFKAELVTKGTNPEYAETMVDAVRRFHQSDTVVNLKMFVSSGIKNT